VLTNHRRAFVWSVLLLLTCVLSLFLVGRQPPAAAPVTTVASVGTLDRSFHDWTDDGRVAPVTWLFRLLAVIGSGWVTVPLRAVASAVLAMQRRWRALASFVLTWITAESTLELLKRWFHRGRPPDPQVVTHGFSFPSGHAVAAAATAVALVLAFFPPGRERRRWEWIAVAFSFTMAFSRVYLNAHWFSDVVAGVLLGAGIAIFWAATVTEIRDIWGARQGRPVPLGDEEPVVAPARAD